MFTLTFNNESQVFDNENDALKSALRTFQTEVGRAKRELYEGLNIEILDLDTEEIVFSKRVNFATTTTKKEAVMKNETVETVAAIAAIAYGDDGIVYCPNCAKKRDYKDHYDNELTKYIITEEEKYFYYCDSCGKFI